MINEQIFFLNNPNYYLPFYLSQLTKYRSVCLKDCYGGFLICIFYYFVLFFQLFGVECLWFLRFGIYFEFARYLKMIFHRVRLRETGRNLKEFFFSLWCIIFLYFCLRYVFFLCDEIFFQIFGLSGFCFFFPLGIFLGLERVVVLEI